MNLDEFFEHKERKENKEIKGALVNTLGYNSIDDILKDGYHLHHTAVWRGYHSRYYASAYPYEGKFGKGVVVEENNPESTYYGKLVSYYVK